MYCKHREVLHREDLHSNPGCSNNATTIPSDDEVIEDDGWIDNANVNAPEFKRLSAMFILKTREEHKVTQAALTGIIQNIKGLWEDNMSNLKVM